MCTVAGTRTLDGERQIAAATGSSKRQDILSPVLLVEIHRQEPTGFVSQQVINPHDVATLKVI
jgi:hypothetical protein